MSSHIAGTNTVFLWQGCQRLADTHFVPIDSTLNISERDAERIQEAWETAKGTGRYDGKLWRYEGYREEERHLDILVSPVRYSAHSHLRHVQGEAMSFYPNPIGVNSIQETAEGNILVGVRAISGDYRGLHLVGAGFIEEGEETDLAAAVRRECEEETAYPNGVLPAGTQHTIALVYGSNHDTGFSVHIPLQIGTREVMLKGTEHSDLLFLQNTSSVLRDVLQSKTYRDLPCTDQMLGSLEAYVAQKAQGRLTSAYQHR